MFEDLDYSQEAQIPLNIENLAGLISTGGAMDCLTANFEQRNSQIDLLKKFVNPLMKIKLVFLKQELELENLLHI